MKLFRLKDSLTKKIFIYVFFAALFTGIMAAFFVFYLIKNTLISESAIFYTYREIGILASSDLAGRIALIVFLIVFLTAIVAIITTSFVLEGFFKPLEKLKKLFETFGKGNSSNKLLAEIEGEMGDFGGLLNEMAENLKRSYQNLYQKVQEENKELEKFQLAVDNASDHIVITDSEGIILYMNKAAENITGFSAKESIGKKAGARGLWGGLMTKNFYNDMWRTIKIKKEVYTGNLTNVRKNGEIYEAEVRISPVCAIESKKIKSNPKFFIGIERDITKVREMDRAKTEFVSLASHQLRTPLASIKWHSEMLLDGDYGNVNKDQKKCLSELYHTNERMIDLVNSLLNVSRIELGTFAVDPVPTDITNLIESVLKEIAVTINIKKLAIKKEYDSNLLIIKVDPLLLRIIFQNLISNAVKYTPKRGKITISISKQKKDVIISVADTGCGIPKKSEPKMFTRLYRADNAKELDSDGSGLGLYVTKAVVEQTGGKIWFKSKENEGTTFYFTIPLAGVEHREGTKALLPEKVH